MLQNVLTIIYMMCEGFISLAHFFFKLSSLDLRMSAYIFYINLFIFQRIGFRLIIINHVICENMHNFSTNIFRIISPFNLATSLFLKASTPNMMCGKIHNFCNHFCLFISYFYSHMYIMQFTNIEHFSAFLILLQK